MKFQTTVSFPGKQQIPAVKWSCIESLELITSVYVRRRQNPSQNVVIIEEELEWGMQES